MLKKLTSRKLWIAVIGIIVGLATVFGVDGESIETVAGTLVSIASVLGYIITEGRVDAVSAGNSPTTTETEVTIADFDGVAYEEQ